MIVGAKTHSAQLTPHSYLNCECLKKTKAGQWLLTVWAKKFACQRRSETSGEVCASNSRLTFHICRCTTTTTTTAVYKASKCGCTCGSSSCSGTESAPLQQRRILALFSKQQQSPLRKWHDGLGGHWRRQRRKVEIPVMIGYSAISTRLRDGEWTELLSWKWASENYSAIEDVEAVQDLTFSALVHSNGVRN